MGEASTPQTDAENTFASTRLRNQVHGPLTREFQPELLRAERRAAFIRDAP
jgi:hypothetical protein